MASSTSSGEASSSLRMLIMPCRTSAGCVFHKTFSPTTLLLQVDAFSFALLHTCLDLQQTL